MNPAEIVLVQDSFRKIARIAPQAAALYYARLFELDPTLREFFGGDMHEQGRELMARVATAVASLGRLDPPAPAASTLGGRPAADPLHAEHSATMGTALLWTLEKGLGGEFTPAVRAAWAHTCTILGDTMIEGQPTTCPA